MVLIILNLIFPLLSNILPLTLKLKEEKVNPKNKTFATELIMIVVVWAVLASILSPLIANWELVVFIFGALATAVIFFFYDDRPIGDFENDRLIWIMSFVIEITVAAVSASVTGLFFLIQWGLTTGFHLTLTTSNVTDQLVFFWILTNLFLAFREFLLPYLVKTWKRMSLKTWQSLFADCTGIITIVLVAAGLVLGLVTLLGSWWSPVEAWRAGGFERLNFEPLGYWETWITWVLGLLAALLGPLILVQQFGRRSVSLGELLFVVLLWVSFGLALWAAANAVRNPWILTVPSIHLVLFAAALYFLERKWYWNFFSGGRFGNISSWGYCD